MNQPTFVSAACVGTAMLASPVLAAGVAPGGALDVTISGFARFDATAGDWNAIQLDRSLSKSLDFSNDTEINIIARGKNDATGLEYGGTVEFEADTDRTDNSDETWIYLRGGFGELRFGDEDGIADADGLALSAATIAAGTGGLDGTRVDTYVTRVFEPFGTSDATKIRYRTPEFAGVVAGVSYTPSLAQIDSGAGNGSNLARADNQAENVFEGGVQYTSTLVGADLALALTGLIGDIKDEITFGSSDYWAWQIGGTVNLFGLQFAGSYLDETVGDGEQKGITVGAAYGYGALDVSINYGLTLDVEPFPTARTFDNPYSLVFSASLGLMPGLVLNGDIQIADNDLTGATADEFKDDSGTAGILELALAF